MKVKFRELLNPLILDEEWIGFQGDSEYMNADGELVFGYWEFHEVDEYGHINRVPYKLDDMIEDYLLCNNDSLFIIENDKGVVCKVKFIY